MLDLHTGHGACYPGCSYLSHMAYVDSLWNGEGFDFAGDPEYWLVEASGLAFGLTADTLGSGYPFRGQLFEKLEAAGAFAAVGKVQPKAVSEPVAK